MKLLNMVSRLIYESFIGRIIFSIQDYIETKRSKELAKARASSMSRSVEVVQKNLLYEGLRRIKGGLKSVHGTDNLKSNIRNMEIQDFAKGDNEKMANLMHRIYVYEGTDIKSEGDKQSMIHKRITHYEELQSNVLKRNLIRAIRKETDPAKRLKLQKEFEEKYAQGH